jgi:hypothetical protein
VQIDRGAGKSAKSILLEQPGAAVVRIHHEDVANAKGFVLEAFFDDLVEGIIGGFDLDGDRRDVCDYLAALIGVSRTITSGMR